MFNPNVERQTKALKLEVVRVIKLSNRLNVYFHLSLVNSKPVVIGKFK